MHSTHIYTMDELPGLKSQVAHLMKSAKNRRNYLVSLAAQTPYSAFTRTTAATKAAEITRVCEELADKLANILSIQEIDDADPNGTSEDSKVRRKYESWEEELQQVQTAATQAACLIQAPTATGGTQATPVGHEQELKSKAVPALKPELLTSDHSMALMLQWLDTTYTYWVGSKFERDELCVQQATFFNLMKPDLQLLMREEVTPVLIIPPPDWKTLPDKVTPSCFKVVIRHWLIRHPLVATRLQFFRHRQAEGQKFSEFIAKHQELSKGCDLEEMKPEDIFVMTLLAGCVDEDMLDELLKINGGKPEDRRQIIEKAEEVEARRSASSTIMGKTGEVSALTGHQKRKQQAMAPKQPGPGTRGSQKPFPAAAQGRCFSCGSKNHLRRDCKVDKDKLSCTHCKTRGNHDSCICLTHMRSTEATTTNKTVKVAEISAVDAADQMASQQQQELSMIEGEFNPLDYQ